ncbi:Protein MAIN-LIKE 2 [Glycine soja]
MYLSLLRSYKDHIVGHVWISQPKDELKLVSHGGKVMHYPTNSMMKRYVDRSRLKGLYDARYMSTNKGVVNVFIERWHSVTSSFHLSIREMTITLNYLSCLLHLSIIVCFLDQTDTTYATKEIRGLVRLELGIMMDQEVDVATSSSNKVPLSLLESLITVTFPMSHLFGLPSEKVLDHDRKHRNMPLRGTNKVVGTRELLDRL